jgi:hypothetical protein
MKIQLLHYRLGSAFLTGMLAVALVPCCNAAISVSLFDGPTKIASGKTYTFRYQLAGSYGPGIGDAPIVTMAFFMGPSSKHDIGKDQQFLLNPGRVHKAIMDRGLWVAPGFVFEIDLTIPTEITATSWPSNQRRKRCLPPGTNFIYALAVTDTTSIKGFSAVIPNIELLSVTPNPARLDSEIHITGDFPNVPTELRINQASVIGAFWSYNSNLSRIDAKIPRTASSSGHIEVSTPLETNISKFVFQLALPDLAFSQDPRGVVHSRFTNQLESSAVVANLPSYVSVTVQNKGSAPSTGGSLRILKDSILLALASLPALAANAEFRVADLQLPPQEPGSFELKLELEPPVLTRESDESNNSLSLSATLNEPSQLEQYLGQYLPPHILANPASVTREADPDDDGFPNALEACFGTHPLEADSAGFGIRNVDGRIELILPRPVDIGQMRFVLESSIDLVTWNQLRDGIDYSKSIVQTSSGPRLALELIDRAISERFMYCRVNCPNTPP